VVSPLGIFHNFSIIPIKFLTFVLSLGIVYFMDSKRTILETSGFTGTDSMRLAVQALLVDPFRFILTELGDKFSSFSSKKAGGVMFGRPLCKK